MIRLICLFFFTISVLTSAAQKGPIKKPSKKSSKHIAQAPATAVVPSPPPTIPSRSGPKSYRDVITDKATTKKGLFIVHKVDDKYYFEIADSLFGREIMAVTRFVKVPANRSSGLLPTYGGELLNQQTLTFEKGPSNNIFMRVVIVENIADTSNAIYKAVSNSNLNAIAAAFPIAAWRRDSSAVVIDVTDFFKGDNQVVSVTPAAKRTFNLSSLASDRSFIESINTYPINTEIRTVKTFNSFPSNTLSLFPSSSVPASSAAGAVTVVLNTSMIILPREPMAIRYWDKRVGYLPESFTLYTDEQQKVNETVFALRWRMEPKDGDIERWKRGELVEPKKPIVYYIDPATPKKWRKYLIQGINDWQVAFEAAGFRNAISGKEWPEDDPGMSMEDARYSVLRYFASDIENAYGGNVNDPRSGEIISTDLRWYHNVMQVIHHMYMVQAAPIDARARTMDFDDSLMGELIRIVSSHEVGHTLGLLHNMGSSNKTNVEKLRDKRWVEANGHTASIMDYARFNYVAQPADNISIKGILPRIGDYDKWAIRWGYGYIPGKTKKEQEIASNKLIIESLKKNPRTYFGTYEFGNRNDPRNQAEDLSDNSIKATEYGIKNLKRLVQNLPDWTKEDADTYTNLSQMYPQVVSQFSRYMSHVASNIGGIYENPKSLEQAGDVYEPVPKLLQKQSVDFISRQLFQTPTWLINKSILNKISQPTSNETVVNVQSNVLSSLLSSSRLNRMLLTANRYGNTTYTAQALMNDVKNSVWTELTSMKPVDFYRRSLQKNYVGILSNLLYSAPGGGGGGFVLQFSGSAPAGQNTDLPSIARAYLINLNNQINAAIPATGDKMTKYHLLDVSDRIKKALNPKG